MNYTSTLLRYESGHLPRKWSQLYATKAYINGQAYDADKTTANIT